MPGKRRYPLFLLLVLLLTLSPACSQKLVDKNFTIGSRDLLIDVRTAKEFNDGHLSGAINIPYTEIRERIGDYTRDRTARIVVYCRSDRRSGIAKETLGKMGYRNVVDAGSYNHLKKLGISKPGY